VGNFKQKMICHPITSPNFATQIKASAEKLNV